jgi:hypothetical protein
MELENKHYLNAGINQKDERKQHHSRHVTT